MNHIEIIEYWMEQFIQSWGKNCIHSISWGITGFNKRVKVCLSSLANLQGVLSVTVAARTSFNNKARSQRNHLT
jgi:hypothetical protein